MGNDTRCMIEGCERHATSRGWCGMHYSRWKRNGDPTKVTRSPRIVGTPSERFWPKVDASGDCWEWAGAINPNGYGVFGLNGKNIGAHRFAYEDLVETIPDGMHIDHMCKYRRCVNPDHLQIVTPGDNVRLGAAAVRRTQQAKSATHCKNGHERTGDNLYESPNGSRVCRKCRKVTQRNFYLKNKTKDK